MQDASMNRKKPGIFINRNYALLWSADLISIAGDYLFDTTLVLWIVTRLARGEAWAPLAVSGVLLAAALPTFLVGPFAGVFVDRWNKRRTMLRMDALRAILIALLLLLTGLVPLPFLPGGQLPVAWTLGILYGLVFLASACAQFFNPSAFALTADVVEEPYLARATGLTQMTGSVATLIGPPLATLLFFTAGVQLAILFNALSFAASLCLILAVRAPSVARSVAEGEQGHFWRELGAGLRFSFRNHVIVTVLIAGFLIIFCEGILTTLGVFFVQQNLHTALTLYGFLATAMGAGAILGALLAAAYAQRLGVARVLGYSLLGYGLLILIYARLNNFFVALCLQFVLGFLVACGNVAIGPITFHITPKELLGRVLAVANPLFAIASLLAISGAGYLDSTVLHDFHAAFLGLSFGPLDTIFLGAGLLATLGGLYAAVNLRGIKIKTGEEHLLEMHENVS